MRWHRKRGEQGLKGREEEWGGGRDGGWKEAGRQRKAWLKEEEEEEEEGKINHGIKQSPPKRRTWTVRRKELAYCDEDLLGVLAFA